LTLIENRIKDTKDMIYRFRTKLKRAICREAQGKKRKAEPRKNFCENIRVSVKETSYFPFSTSRVVWMFTPKQEAKLLILVFFYS